MKGSAKTGAKPPLALKISSAHSAEFLLKIEASFDSSQPDCVKAFAIFQLSLPGDLTVQSPKTTPLNYRNPTTMTYEQFQQLQNERVRNSLWRDYAAKQDGKGALGGRGLLPKLDLPPGLDRIFGNGISDIKPNGFVLLDFGIRHQRIDNPLTPVFQRKNTTFFFDQQININLNGKIGGNPAAAVNGINPGGLSILTNFDTKASFNFEN